MKIIYANSSPHINKESIPILPPHLDTLLRELRHVHPPKHTENFAQYLQSCMHPLLLTSSEKASIIVACDVLDMLMPSTEVFKKYLA